MLAVKMNTSGIDLAELFEREAADTKHKTGYFTGTGVDWYTRRDGSNARVIRVQYHEPRTTKKRLVELYDGRVIEYGRDMVRKNQLFPFTLEGLRAAVEFHKEHDKW